MTFKQWVKKNLICRFVGHKLFNIPSSNPHCVRCHRFKELPDTLEGLIKFGHEWASMVEKRQRKEGKIP